MSYSPNAAHYPGMLVHLREQRQTMFRDLVHNFPADILSYIFTLNARDFGSMFIPFKKDNSPPQMIASHVCSRWRQVALDTHELWNDITLKYTDGRLERDSYFERILRGLSSRAGGYPLSLSLGLDDYYPVTTEFVNHLAEFIKPFRIKKLELALEAYEIRRLSPLDNLLPELEELSLGINGIVLMPQYSSDVPRIISKTRSVFISFDLFGTANGLDSFMQIIPFKQLRNLDLRYQAQPMSIWVDILRETPLLESCILHISSDLIPENLGLIFPHLRMFCLYIQCADISSDRDDIVIRHLTLPNLTRIILRKWKYQSNNPYMAVKQKCNLHRLEDVDFDGYHEPLSTLLKDAPLMRRLRLIIPNANIDDEAVIGISTGALGRSLRKLDLQCDPSDVGKVLDMLEARKRRVDMWVETGCRREELTTIKDVTLVVKNHLQVDVLDVEFTSKRISVLKELGIIVNLQYSGT